MPVFSRLQQLIKKEKSADNKKCQATKGTLVQPCQFLDMASHCDDMLGSMSKVTPDGMAIAVKHPRPRQTQLLRMNLEQSGLDLLGSANPFSTSTLQVENPQSSVEILSSRKP